MTPNVPIRVASAGANATDQAVLAVAVTKVAAVAGIPATATPTVPSPITAAAITGAPNAATATVPFAADTAFGFPWLSSSAFISASMSASLFG